MEKVLYFLGLAMKASIVIFWKVIKRRENGAYVNMKYLIKKARIAEQHDNLTKGIIALETIDKMITKSENKYIAIKNKHVNIENHLQQH